jgi:hypothetical protein
MALDFDKFLASFLPQIPKKMYSQVAKSSPTMAAVMRKGATWDSGGDTFQPHIKHKHSTAVGSYKGYDTLDITPQDTRAAAEFKLKQYYSSIIFNGYEEAASSGENAVFKMAEIAVKDAEEAIRDKFATDLFGNGTGNSNKALLGLAAAVDDGTNVGTYGGIDRATNTFWKSQVDFTAAALTVARMRELYMKCVRGGNTNRPDFIVTDLNQWNNYAELIDGKTNIQQPTGKLTDVFANLGFAQLSFMGVPVVYDEYCSANTIFMLNSETTQLHTKPGRNFKPSEMVKISNMDAKAGQIFWAGELICTEPRANGKLTATA